MNPLIPSERPAGERVPALADEWGTGLAVPGGYPGGYPTGIEPSLDTVQARGRLALLWMLDVLLKRKLLICAVCLVALAAGFIKAYLTTPIYEASTTIQIDLQAPRVLSNRQQAGVEDFTREPFFLQTQYELLKSRSLAERVARSLDSADIAAMTQPVSSPWSRLRRAVSGGATPPSEPALTADAIEAGQARVVGMIMGGLSVQPVPMSRIVRITFASTHPATAQKISVAVAENFLASMLDRRVNASAYARSFFEERLQQVKLKLEDSERQLVAYARKEGIANLDDKQPETTARLAAINTSLSAATAERVRNEQLWNQAQSGNGLSLPQVMADKAVQTAREKRAQLMTDYQDKLNILKPAFPEMIQIRTQISELDRQIKTQVELVRESVRVQYEASKAQEQSLMAMMAQLRDQALDVRTRSIQYNILQRELDTNKALYDGLLQQYKELGVAAGLGTNNVSIVDRAEIPGAPVSPRLAKILAIALAIGLIVACAVVYVLELLDDTFKGAENLEETLGLTALGVIPLSDQSTTTVIETVVGQPQSGVAESYRSLRTALQFSTESGVPRVLLVTSAKPGEGKSTTSVSLAVNFAQLGMRVLLIDADLRNPSIGRYLKVESKTGLSNYLAGAAEIGDLPQPCFVDGVSVITAGALPPNPAELLAGPKLPALLAQMSESFDIILIDSPPVMGLADAPILSSIAAGTLLVIQSNVTRRGLVRAAVKRLRFARARLVGTVLSKFNADRSGYTYSYAYNYSYSYNYPSRSLDAAKTTKLATKLNPPEPAEPARP
ncbi:capsular exopolysaccharide family [Methylobacterium sp. 174MFSha1.1]|uniref:GumC family protein n=1 Tax=Methylobacterium sp. 174MFSha1.1 TaxID=1502749 RepID=UPI0008EA7402|nr:polysaccharide biosynthesis tyrosine autokinase [Methylobacterium sp. 174MFSha1.1]SFU47089.1 capsular exopolysaccharide family [Methylobacterium sp. 174MFSha1.1]